MPADMLSPQQFQEELDQIAVGRLLEKTRRDDETIARQEDLLAKLREDNATLAFTLAAREEELTNVKALLAARESEAAHRDAHWQAIVSEREMKLAETARVLDTIQHSRYWRVLQGARGVIGRKW